MFFRFSNMSPCYQHVYFRYRHNIGITISDHLSCCSSYIVFHRSCTKFNCCKIRRMHYNLGRGPMKVLDRQFGDGGDFCMVWLSTPSRPPVSERRVQGKERGSRDVCDATSPMCQQVSGMPLRHGSTPITST